MSFIILPKVEEPVLL